MTGQKFNDDLLLSKEDRLLAQRSFPALYPVLDFPELRELFAKYDEMAKTAKIRRRVAGSIAIAFGVCALLGASAEPLYECLDTFWKSTVGLVLAGCGITSVVVGTFGVFSDTSKNEWLRGRLMTERLRQFQFQLLVHRTPRVFAVMENPAAAEEFHQQRLSWLSKFSMRYEQHPASKLIGALKEEQEEEFWLHPDEGLPDLKCSQTDVFFEAYSMLRIEHQIQYADYKLRKDGFSSVYQQIKILTEMSLISILAVFVLHILIILSLISFFKPWINVVDAAWVHVLIVWTAICALTARAIEEGLQPTREQERYRSYSAALVNMRTRFDDAEPSGKFQIMREVEHLVYTEMGAFLKLNDEARFVL